MSTIVKQVVGIDVSQHELVVQLGRMSTDLLPELHASKCFPNTVKGFGELSQWVAKLTLREVPVRYIMEATGVYHQLLAYHLDENGDEVSIVLPSKISNYMRTLDKKTINDRTCAEAIALFGLERKLEQWTRPSGVYRELSQLTRERGQLIEQRTMCKNQLHAEKAEARPNAKSIIRIQSRIGLLEKQEKEILAEIKELIKEDETARQAIVLLCSIPGIGILTAATVLGETGGFDLIRNKKQLVSYAGLDVKEKQSGTSVNGKPRISKRGNKHIRKAMYLPALAAIRHDQRYKATFARLVARHGIKMKAAVAVQRKLLEMMYTVYKKQEKYDSSFLMPQSEEIASVMGQTN